MEGKGWLKSITKDWASGKILLTFEFDQDISSQIESIKDKLLRITAKIYRKKRSLDANAYYWVMVTQLADVLHVSEPFMHNMMLRKYGQDEIINGKLMYVSVPDDGESKADESGNLSYQADI